MTQVAGAVGDLARSRRALDTLIRSTDDVVHAVQRDDAAIGQLLDGGAETFTAIARRSDAVRTTLDETGETLESTRDGLEQADGTLGRVDAALVRLAPGVDELREIARPLSRLLDTTVDVVPDARRTVATLGRATVDLDPLLTRARALMPRVESVSTAGADQLRCIRPYASEIAGFFGTWVAFQSRGDDRDTYARVSASLYPHPTSLNTASAANG